MGASTAGVMRQVAGVFALAGLAACGHRTVTVQGDVFENVNGTVHSGAGREMLLVSTPDSVPGIIRGPCSTYERESRAAYGSEAARAAELSVKFALRAYLRDHAVAHAGVDIHGHYRLEHVPPGTYALAAQSAGLDDELFVQRLELTRARDTVIDLTFASKPTYLCGTLGVLVFGDSAAKRAAIAADAKKTSE